MPHAKDGLYLFSMARGDLGRIVASRFNEKRDCIGRSFFAKFGIDSAQIDKMKATMGENSGAFVFALEGKKKDSHIFLVFSHFCYETGLFVAVEPRVSAKTIKYLLHRGSFDNVISCFEDTDFAENDVSEADTVDYIEGYKYICEIFAYFNPLLRSIYKRERHLAEDVELNFGSLAEFIGLSVNYSIKRESMIGQSCLVYAGGFCAIAFVLMAMMAYKYSANNALNFEAKCHGDISAFRLSFVMGSRREWMENLEALSLIAIGCHDIYISYRELDQDDGSTLLTLEFLPFYEDSGLLGVKRRESFFDDPNLMDFNDFFILKRITYDKINNNEQ